ncbi:MAG: hypothetical protein QXI92_00165 [Candidatus Nitrosocaldus sp.]
MNLFSLAILACIVKSDNDLDSSNSKAFNHKRGLIVSVLICINPISLVIEQYLYIQSTLKEEEREKERRKKKDKEGKKNNNKKQANRQAREKEGKVRKKKEWNEYHHRNYHIYPHHYYH